MSKLLLVSGDLMLGARVDGAARQLGLTMHTVGEQSATVAAVDENYRVVLVDLRTSGVNVADLVESLRQAADNLVIVACAPHVHEERLEAARQAGCDLVVTRGQLDRELEQILQRIVEQP